MELSELYQELIIDHGTEPRNYHALANANHSADGYNPLCGDKIKLYLVIEDIPFTDDFSGRRPTSESPGVHTKCMTGVSESSQQPRKSICEGYSIIKEVSFVGAGCAISTASASIMTEILIGKTKLQALEMLKQFKLLVTGKELTASNLDNLGKLLALAGVRAFPSRIKCATLAWHTLDAALQHKHELATTE